ncbi:efflux RND transporter periplasmic adaptor subunit [Rehaibacterium terrae]|uniref:Cu(I)/Ag(I) efflux system membrane fusion protein n=1 Tax=Rehaibacterium terrae TaxID=1341696 RepID=A0A7W8DD67_9GAMM|nr:efflux RND transporter periplasmic adaptor subunit [Rehaibacterium terrae]MBB5014970.1 Cu(I)/Ag(I) efflux system membrane fusion protein [Rehaibacterium terrae]
MHRAMVFWTMLAAALALALGVAIGRLSAPAHAPAEAARVEGERRVLYYRNPMGLPDTSPVPKKDPMGMDYIPVHEGEEDDAAQGGIAISPERIQTLGVRTESAVLAPWQRSVRAVGRFEAAEPGLATVTTKFEGWIERLHVNAVGQRVRAGEPLMAVYSPELVSAQREYLVALDARRRLAEADPDARHGAEALLDAARQRLRNWDIPAAAIARLERTGEVRRTLVLPAPVDGVVLQRMATLGMRTMPGERLFELADLSELWLMIDVFEQDLDAAVPGAGVAIEVAAEPGQPRDGRIDFVYPVLDEDTRTTRVRVRVDNADGRLRPGMFATATLQAGDDAPTLSVPDSAVLDTGLRQLVIVARGSGRFEPREVRAGRRAEGRIEILDGLAHDERVVTRANFLIDAESNLRAAVTGLAPGHAAGDRHDGHDGHGMPPAPPASGRDPHEGHQGHDGHDASGDDDNDDDGGDGEDHPAHHHAHGHGEH